MIGEAVAKLWYRPPRLAYALAPIGWIYRAAGALRRALYRAGILASERPEVPVVIVGNIAVGGTGKTPCTIWLAQALAARGFKPGVVSRSYAASARTAGPVYPNDDPNVHGDEAVLLANRLAYPVWSGPRRARTARALLEAHPDVDVLVCDDGLQHYALARDVEIVLIDAERGFGNGLCLPAGPLREPRSRLRNVDAIVVNGEAGAAALPQHVPRYRMRMRAERFRNLADNARTAAAQDFEGKRVAAVAGIANPARFFAQLHALGIRFSVHAFADHHPYSASDLRLDGAQIVLMTEKDAIKCARFGDHRMWMLPVSADIEAGLLELVIDRIGARSRPAYDTRATGLAN
ncbi:MAG: tetraacyldisaccharide 4'-kinase [Burkholderiales bacterium]|nr:tetraacyldisaccharide 4'-kinase [Burkholderiales bacterium]